MVKSQRCTPQAQTSSQPRLCPACKVAAATGGMEVVLFTAWLVFCVLPARSARYLSLCGQGGSRAGLTATCCPSPFVRALMCLMMNSQAFEKGLCLPETRTKYNKLKIAASLWNMPTSPTENPVECKFA